MLSVDISPALKALERDVR